MISIVVAARNEANGIINLLDALARQEYPTHLWEAIIVNDHSEDATATIIDRFIQIHDTLPIRHILSSGTGKKAAIETGVEEATGEWILQTDADCIPGPRWISSMSESMRSEIRFVSGPIRLLPQDHWFHYLQALEMLGLVTLGAGSMLGGFPNMANGANMAYHRQTFLEIGGFGTSREVASGDDEFLVQSIHKIFPGSLTFAKQVDAIVETATLDSWAAFRSQRVRWVSKAKSYINKTTNLIQLTSWLGFVSFAWWIAIGLFDPGYLPVPILLFIMKLAADRWLMKAGALFLQKTEWLRWLLLLEIMYIPYVIWIGIRGNLNTAYVWKDRKTT